MFLQSKLKTAKQTLNYYLIVSFVKMQFNMTTITIQTSNDYGQKLYQKLKADKNLRKIELKEELKGTIVNEIELVLPGLPMTDEMLLSTLRLASKGRSLSLKNARKKTMSKIAAWRKSK